MNRTRTRPQGQALAEFALVISLLVILLLVVIDLGRVVYSYSALHNATREGARYGIINPTDTSGIVDRVRQYAIALDQSQLTVTPLYNATAKEVTVTSIYDFRTATMILDFLVGTDAFTLTSVSKMATEE